ncbi:MAG: hypothetical protein LUG24_10985 [Clostridiales bacterium]|nr:hypothetical protein [Clostridiales bacterium]
MKYIKSNTAVIILTLTAASVIIIGASLAVVYFTLFGSNPTGGDRKEEPEPITEAAEELTEETSEETTEKTEKTSETSEETTKETAKEAASNPEREEIVSLIYEKYEVIISEAASGEYEIMSISDGVCAYSDGDSLKAVAVSMGVDGSSYTKAYYYEDSALFCACYKGSDTQVFFYSEGRLIRQRYYPDTNNTEYYEDYDEGAKENTAWENKIASEAENLYFKWQVAAALESAEDNSEGENRSNDDADYDREYFETLLTAYCENMCSAVNAGDYGIVEGNILPGSSFELSQLSLVNTLYSEGTKESLVSCVLNDFTADSSYCYMYVTETEDIIYENGSTETVTYNMKYSAVSENGSWLLFDGEQIQAD